MAPAAPVDVELDLIEEIRLRTWARANYVPAEERDDTWHQIILDEMERRDREAADLENLKLG